MDKIQEVLKIFDNFMTTFSMSMVGDHRVQSIRRLRELFLETMEEVRKDEREKMIEKLNYTMMKGVTNFIKDWNMAIDLLTQSLSDKKEGK